MSLCVQRSFHPRESVADAAIAYWNSLPRVNDVPARSSFDPVHIPALLPYVIFLEVLSNPLDFRYRVIGSHCREYFFADYTGRTMLSLGHITADGELFHALKTVITERRPLRTNIPYVGPRNDFRKNSEVMIPLCGVDGAITHILIFLVFDTIPHRVSLDPL